MNESPIDNHMDECASLSQRASKYLSWLLRHHPPSCMTEDGYVPVDFLIDLINRDVQKGFTHADLETLVATNNKQRFAYNGAKTHLRASQGHSIDVDLGMTAREPPSVLYHGTAEKFVESIMRTGILKQGRQHVHMTTNRHTAKTVGARHGKPVVLVIDARRMHADGHHFFLSDNNVWLTDSVLPKYIAVHREPSNAS